MKYSGHNISECRSEVSYPDSTHTGSSYDGINPDGTFTGSSAPSPFLIKDNLRIEVDINKAHDCSNHYFVIANSATYRPFDQSKEPGTVKVYWACGTVVAVDEDVDSYNYDYYDFSSTFGIHHMVINHSPTGVTVTTDLDNVDIDEEADFWSEVWLWMGADKPVDEMDKSVDADFHNLTISYTTSCNQGNRNPVNLTAYCTWFLNSKPFYLLTQSFSGL